MTPNVQGEIPQRLNKKSYSELCTLDNRNVPTVFSRREYKVAVSILVTSKRMRHYVLDIGTETNLLLKEVLSRDWISTVKISAMPQLWRSKNQELNIIGSFMLFLRIGDVRVSVVFRIAR